MQTVLSDQNHFLDLLNPKDIFRSDSVWNLTCVDLFCLSWNLLSFPIFLWLFLPLLVSQVPRWQTLCSILHQIFLILIFLSNLSLDSLIHLHLYFTRGPMCWLQIHFSLILFPKLFPNPTYILGLTHRSFSKVLHLKYSKHIFHLLSKPPLLVFFISLNNTIIFLTSNWGENFNHQLLSTDILRTVNTAVLI